MTQNVSDDAQTVRLGPSVASRCRRRVHLDGDPAADRSAKTLPDSTFQLRMSDLARHREEVLSRFQEQLPPRDSADCGEEPQWTPQSLERPALLRGITLRSQHRYGVIDVLLWNGDGYLPVIIRGHRTLDVGAGASVSTLRDPLGIEISSNRKLRPQPRDVMVLAHFARLLAELGLGSTRAMGGVIGRGGRPGIPRPFPGTGWMAWVPPP
ncbi:hypothetical protein EH165_01430 [Nakamurella antarctica]|uniref:Uncharacterized protein n=1 Tax=Nakamurella antarctica TaxID=1902245 RepID=A0A3G8ZIM5_9ACTN|nr:hypothetical protein [Nakamurella antarctica]AZI57028.1 hypothetical protein EH165_01430 [Nakamurella antarctica]